MIASRAYLQHSGATIPRMKPPGSERKTYGKTTHTYFLTNPNLEGEIHLKGGRFVTSQTFNLECYAYVIICISYFICNLGFDPRNSKQLKELQRELGISFIFIFEFFSNIEKRIILVLIIFLSKIFPILKIKERR